MFIPTRHSKEVRIITFIRALYYSFLPPQYSYVKKLKRRFGTSSLQYLNVESFLHDFLKVHPNRTPSKSIAVEAKFFKRFSRLILKSGLQPITFKGQKELSFVLRDDRLLAVILPEAYDVSAKKYLKDYESSRATKIILQSRKKPRTVSLDHSIFIWEPRFLPRAVSGAVTYIDPDTCADIYGPLKSLLYQRDRLESKIILKHVWKALKGQEDKYRLLDRRPALILARLVYDGVK